MKVVALVSGGKDSCFSIHLCEANGHQVVALGNLLPVDSNIDELDSYMYQTVGHQLVAAYATCTGLPLYRRRITGHSNTQGLSYSVTTGDEVEDLYLLLAYIKECHPDIQAVASGAIASDYQRLRVESVCSRLGLVSLAYLWHQPQDKLLSDMIANNIEAVLVKVAAIGLDPHKHLGKSIRQLQPHLRRLRDMYGCNVCGEGGEYETLTLDCPAFKYGRIVLDDWQVVLHSPDSIAPVGVLHPSAFHIEPKQETDTDPSVQQQQEQQPGSSSVIEVPADWQPIQSVPDAGTAQQQQPAWRVDTQLLESPQHMQIIASAAAAAAADDEIDVVSFSADDTAEALGSALRSITARLSGLGLSWASSLFVHLYLADMAHFGVANAEYCKHLPQVNPPSRACVQVPLPAGCPVLLDALFARPQTTSDTAQQPIARDASSKQQQQQQQQQHQQLDRRVLHVQSISSWAPSCIGPYSQATSCNGLIFMAGQIPLDPASMNIVQPESAAAQSSSSSSRSVDVSPRAIACQVWRTLCSCQAVAVAVKGCVATASLALTVYLSDACAAAGGQAVVQAALQAMWRDRDLLDCADIPPDVLAAAEALAQSRAVAASSPEQQAAHAAGTAAAAGMDPSTASKISVLLSHHSDAESDDGSCCSDAAVIDDYLRPPAMSCVMEPAVLYVTVPALPRGALLEVQPVLLDLSAAPERTDSSSDGDEDSQQPRAEQAYMLSQGQKPQEKPLQTLEQSCPASRVSVHISPNADVQCSSSWERILLLLPRGSVDGGNDGSSSSLADAACRAQVAAAAAQLGAALRSLQGGSSAVSVCMLRCYYESFPASVSATSSGRSDQHSWRAALSAELQQVLAEMQQKTVAVQYVPVTGLSSSNAASEAYWAAIEVFVCRA